MHYDYNWLMDKKEIEEVFRQLNLLSDFKEQAPVLFWEEVVDDRLASSSEALYVRDGTLHVRVVSSSAAAEIRLKSEGLIKRLNGLSGRRQIRRIKIEVGGEIDRPD